jgi:uncharacterized protein YqjF (DUF2071 family)
MLNYEIDPKALAPLVPAGTELDSWQGRTYVSLVGFRFLDTRVLGIPIPLHRNFEEVNLRFYVQRKAEDGWRRGVVFVKEIVPRFAIAFVARWLYNENYVALPMRHELRSAAADPSCVESVAYAWHAGGREHRLSLAGAGAPQPLVPGSEAEFIAEHYWGYTRQPDGGTVEYKVEHPPWRVATAARAELDCDVRSMYGDRFAEALGRPPSSAFLADGSAISVSHGSRLLTHRR